MIQRLLPQLPEWEPRVQKEPQALLGPRVEQGLLVDPVRVPILDDIKTHIQPTHPVCVQVRPNKCTMDQGHELRLL